MYTFKHDYYKILNVPFNADKDEIKKAYLKCAKLYHPDCGGDPEKFKLIHEAYEILSDEKTRYYYDEWYMSSILKQEQQYNIHNVYMYVFYPHTDSQEKILKTIDFSEFPPEKYADVSGCYYGIEVPNDNGTGNTVYICTKEEWYRILNNHIKQINDYNEKINRKEFIRKCIAVAIIFLIILTIGISITDFDEHVPISNNANTEDISDLNLTERTPPQHGFTTHKFYDSDITSVLEIKLAKNDSTNYYYIKVVECDSDKEVQSVFMYPGTTIEIPVPLGTYNIKYACGETWYGFTNYFGPYGSYAKADDVFEFTYEYGHTITLYPVTNGNLTTENIPLSSF